MLDTRLASQEVSYKMEIPVNYLPERRVHLALRCGLALLGLLFFSIQCLAQTPTPTPVATSTTLFGTPTQQDVEGGTSASVTLPGGGQSVSSPTVVFVQCFVRAGNPIVTAPAGWSSFASNVDSVDAQYLIYKIYPAASTIDSSVVLNFDSGGVSFAAIEAVAYQGVLSLDVGPSEAHSTNSATATAPAVTTATNGDTIVWFYSAAGPNPATVSSVSTGSIESQFDDGTSPRNFYGCQAIAGLTAGTAGTQPSQTMTCSATESWDSGIVVALSSISAPTPTPTSTPVMSPTASASPASSNSPTASASPTNTANATSSASPTASATLTPIPSPTSSVSAIPSPSPTSSANITASASPTATASPTPTSSTSSTVTATPTATPTTLSYNTVTASPYTIAATDQTLYCGTGASELDLPAATGTQRVIIAKATGATSCFFKPNGSDTVDGQNVNYTVPLKYMYLGLLDSSSGTWSVITYPPYGYNNYGDSLTGSADIGITSSYTLIFEDSLVQNWAMVSDMCVTGQVEFTNTGGAAGTVNIAIGLWNANSSNPTCIIDEDIPNITTPITRPISCCAFNNTAKVGTAYYASAYAKTTMTGLTAKYKDASGTQRASYWDMVVNPTF